MALADALVTVPHIATPSVVLAPSEQHAQELPGTAESRRSDDR
jgi:hypothetical protein